MSLAKSGQIGNVCLPNALMTLCEYSIDYGDAHFMEKAASMIKNEIPNISNESVRRKTIKNLEKISTGQQRDFFV
jgi:2-iminoacetate synthase